MNEFHDSWIDEQGIEFTEAEFTENHDWIKQQLKSEMYITAFSVEEPQRLHIETDPVVQKAVEAMPKAKALIENAEEAAGAAHGVGNGLRGSS